MNNINKWTFWTCFNILHLTIRFLNENNQKPCKVLSTYYSIKPYRNSHRFQDIKTIKTFKISKTVKTSETSKTQDLSRHETYIKSFKPRVMFKVIQNVSDPTASYKILIQDISYKILVQSVSWTWCTAWQIFCP